MGNQGSVITADDDYLIAVNAGSNSISLFKIKSNGLQLKSTVSSGGMRPISLTQEGDLVYVLNAGGAGNISGFKLDDDKLMPLSNSTKPLSSAASGPAQISFVNNGNDLVITEKATNKIITYTVNQSGRPDVMHQITAANPTPFGFAVGKNGKIFVSEAVGGAPGASTVSSYNVKDNGEISLVTGPVATTQSAACWVVLTGNGKYAYTTNTASATISSFNTNNLGGLTLGQAVATTTGAGPIDAALSNNSKYLYVLNNGAHAISGYKVAADGSLTSVDTESGIVIGANGLAAF